MHFFQPPGNEAGKILPIICESISVELKDSAWYLLDINQYKILMKLQANSHITIRNIAIKRILAVYKGTKEMANIILAQ